MFASLDGLELAAHSGPTAQVAGEAFIANLGHTASASVAASNDSLPSIESGQGLSI